MADARGAQKSRRKIGMAMVGDKMVHSSTVWQWGKEDYKTFVKEGGEW